MHDLISLGYAHQLERAYVEERRRTSLAIHLAARRAGYSEAEGGGEAMPSPRQLPRRYARQVLGTVSSWLAAWPRRVAVS